MTKQLKIVFVNFSSILSEIVFKIPYAIFLEFQYKTHLQFELI